MSVCVCMNAVMSEDCAHNPVILPDLQRCGLFHLDLPRVRWRNGRWREAGDDGTVSTVVCSDSKVCAHMQDHHTVSTN